MTPLALLTVVAAGALILFALMRELQRRTPSWIDPLTAMTAAVAIDVAIHAHERRAFDLASIAAAYPGQTGFPHACPCLALSFLSVLMVLRFMR